MEDNLFKQKEVLNKKRTHYQNQITKYRSKLRVYGFTIKISDLCNDFNARLKGDSPPEGRYKGIEDLIRMNKRLLEDSTIEYKKLMDVD